MTALVLMVPLVASADNNLNLDTGKTGGTGFGDITFNGTSIAPVGSAQLSDLGTSFSSDFSTLFGNSFYEAVLAALPYATTPISGTLVLNDVLAVHTNGGNYAGLLVTAISSSSITLQFFTYNTTPAQVQAGSATLGTQSGPAAPSISAVLNNYSSTLPNAPNYGIAPGTLLAVYGSDLAEPGAPVVLQDASQALPLTLNGSSASVTVNGTTVQPAYYYTTPGQIGLVLPSSTPVGTGTITVTYGGQTSQPAPIKIVAHAFGFDSLSNTGTGPAGVRDNNDGYLIESSCSKPVDPVAQCRASATPGEYIVFYGSGDGANIKNTDVSPPTNFDPVNGITAFYFGNVQVPMLYQGRDSYQGQDQINVQVPAGALLGCAVSISAVSGTGSSAIASNLVTIPVTVDGGACADPTALVDPTLAATLAGKTTVKFGGVVIAQQTTFNGTTPAVQQEAAADFWSISGSSLDSYSSSQQPPLGSCSVTQTNSTTFTNPFTLTGLNAGSVSVTGPSGTFALATFPQVPGIYGVLSAPNGTFSIPAGGGIFTFTGTGGTDVGAFNDAQVKFLNPLVWSNSSSEGTVDRSEGVTVTWTGGASNTFVQIQGNSVSSTNAFSASFTCDAPVGAGSFTVPPAVLLALPAGSGTLTVSNYTNPTSPTIPDLDFAFAMGYASTQISATYN